MKLFDGIIEGILPELSKAKQVELSSWPESNPNELLFHSDEAFELGGGTLPALGVCLLTSNPSFVKGDGAYLIGEDIGEIHGDSPYARIALLEVEDECLGEGNALYQSIRRIDYVRYHVSPKGFMTRISPLSGRESVRVGKIAIKEGMSFGKIASSYIEEYKKQKGVKAAKMFFITDPSFPFDKLSEANRKNEEITKALDHLLNKVSMDCHSCSLQKICEEVESMVESDFKKTKAS